MACVQTRMSLENETLKIIWDLQMQINHSIIARRADVVLI